MKTRSLAVTAVILAACSSGTSAPPHADSLGCYSGPFHLKASPDSASEGQTVTLAAAGRWGVSDTVHDVGTDSYGLLGTSEKGEFVAKYNVAAIAQGVQHEPNIPVGSSEGLSAVGLPNRPFQIVVPDVSPGNYIVKFTYSVTPGGRGPRNYELCAKLDVKAS